ncbi:MAG: peptidylprolyl isomerase [Lachnospiraceae bacterium]|nr:peptidylprolyl isomerase [Lachnospiraceae bacterium]
MHSCRRLLNVLSVCLLLLLLSGCGLQEVRAFLDSNTRIIITTGLDEEELFRIEDATCSPTEYLVYLINMQKTYEEGFSSDLWSGEEGEVLAQSIRANALARISRVKTMTLLAQTHDISLTGEETAQAQAIADAYYETLSEAELTAMGNVEPSTLRSMVADYLLAKKLYRYLIRDIDPEISDDEARRVTVRQIVLRTWDYDESGAVRPFDSEGKRHVYALANQIRRDWEDGADFADLAAIWNEADQSELIFGRGEADPQAEAVAFSLGNGEVSQPFETKDGVILFYMESTFDRSETDANKVRIMNERRHEAFDEEYDVFAEGLSRTFNSHIYAQLNLTTDPEVTTDSFFRICEEAAELLPAVSQPAAESTSAP